MDFQYKEKRTYNNKNYILDIGLSYDHINNIHYIFVDFIYNKEVVYFVDFTLVNYNIESTKHYSDDKILEFDENKEVKLIINKFNKLKSFI